MRQSAPTLLPLVAAWGCGNVFPRRDRKRLRCGGPAFCGHCLLDLAFCHMVEAGDAHEDLQIVVRKNAWLRPIWHNYADPLNDGELLYALRAGRVAEYVLRLRPGLW